MRAKTTATMIGVLMVAAVPALADNDMPGADWMPKDQVTKKLEGAGYTNITGLQADDGHWEGKGVKNGKITEFHVDPHSGAVTKEQVDND